MNITKEKLTQLLSEAFDEGMAGYLELKESFLSEMVEKFDQEEKKSSVKIQPIPNASSTGTSYSSRLTFGEVSVPSVISFETMPMTPIVEEFPRHVADEPMIVNGGRIGGIDVAVPTNVQDFRNIEINWQVDGVATVTGTWDYLHRPPTTIVTNTNI